MEERVYKVLLALIFFFLMCALPAIYKSNRRGVALNLPQLCLRTFYLFIYLFSFFYRRNPVNRALKFVINLHDGSRW